VQRGEVWWANLPEPAGSGPGFVRPVVVIQADALNRSRIGTVVVAAVTSNLRLRDFPGNVYLSARDAGLERASVVNTSQLATVDRSRLIRHLGNLRGAKLRELDDGLRQILSL
jgi:mRNA interferase MazF